MSPKKDLGDPLEKLEQVVRTGKIGGSSHSQPQSSKAVIPQNDNTALQENAKTVIRQSDNTVLPQNDNTVIPQSDIAAKQQKRTKTKTDARVKLTFYMDSEDVRRFDDLRYRYNRDHETRLDQNKFMRLIMKRLDLTMLEEFEER